jgi:hypothetical protein
MNTVLTAASPDVFRNARLLGPFDLSFAMFNQGCLSSNDVVSE